MAPSAHQADRRRGFRCELGSTDGSNSAALTGNNKSATDKGGYDVYRSEAITESMTSKEGTALTTEDECRLAMVFIALLAGGDYVPEGLNHFGASSMTDVRQGCLSQDRSLPTAWLTLAWPISSSCI